jgi:hypothetical protein
MATERFVFEFEFDPRFRRLLALLGIRPSNSEVVLTDSTFSARFGRLRARTPVSNLKDVRITRDYRWFKAIGPRGSAADRGATFGTNTRAGVCVCFHQPITALPGNRQGHPALTVTVADPERLAAAIQRRIDGRPGG